MNKMRDCTSKGSEFAPICVSTNVWISCKHPKPAREPRCGQHKYSDFFFDSDGCKTHLVSLIPIWQPF